MAPHLPPVAAILRRPACVTAYTLAEAEDDEETLADMDIAGTVAVDTDTILTPTRAWARARARARARESVIQWALV